MRIAQIVLPSASAYERKSQRADLAALGAKHEVALIHPDEADPRRFDVAHVYATGELPAAVFRRFPLPFVAPAGVKAGRWTWRKPVQPGFVASPLTEPPLPEVVEEQYFEARAREGQAGSPVLHYGIGTYGPERPGVKNIVEQSLARIARFRGDISWQLFDHPPTPEDFASLHAWVDPATKDEDFDGFVAEAMVSGVITVATRTPINLRRTEKGRTGVLAPSNDPNELVHAILGALFKPEVAARTIEAARHTVSKYHARQRLRVLIGMYETLIR